MKKKNWSMFFPSLLSSSIISFVFCSDSTCNRNQSISIAVTNSLNQLQYSSLPFIDFLNHRIQYNFFDCHHLTHDFSENPINLAANKYNNIADSFPNLDYVIYHNHNTWPDDKFFILWVFFSLNWWIEYIILKITFYFLRS